ncbi:hypothetical protein B0H12DRAFT_1127586 [Mycena haematopus]|nr:hypothetical protein B0H12DRAFT_1127586 [Mycena haematopus]
MPSFQCPWLTIREVWRGSQKRNYFGISTPEMFRLYSSLNSASNDAPYVVIRTLMVLFWVFQPQARA